MPKRKIVHIDETKCDGCGLCVPSCAEGAIQIVNGKARLVSDVYCDGLGACLGECPRGAITIIEREAADFDEAAAHRHVARLRQLARQGEPVSGGCPGSAVADFRRSAEGLPIVGGPRDARNGSAASGAPAPSALGHWPIQLRLVPPSAPFLQGADLLLAADCVAFALADFHERFLRDKAVAIACPKLDDTRPYVEKLAAIFAHASIRSLTVIHMEVPCCMGLLRIAQAARHAAAVDVPLREVVISTRGEVLRESAVAG
jgi:Pyruvate/2-oxoacid:ferredoxin oxidoreductase delta subunit